MAFKLTYERTNEPWVLRAGKNVDINVVPEHVNHHKLLIFAVHKFHSSEVIDPCNDTERD